MLNNQAQSATGPRMSGYAAFVSAPTLELARTMRVLTTLPLEQRSSIATGVLAHMQSIDDLNDDVELSTFAERLQKQRWKLVFEAADDLSNSQFSIILLTENWLQAQQKLSPKRSKMIQLLAQEGLRMIENFLKDNLPQENQFDDTSDVEVSAMAA
jgi:hypothetical protein